MLLTVLVSWIFEASRRCWPHWCWITQKISSFLEIEYFPKEVILILNRLSLCLKNIHVEMEFRFEVGETAEKNITEFVGCLVASSAPVYELQIWFVNFYVENSTWIQPDKNNLYGFMVTCWVRCSMKICRTESTSWLGFQGFVLLIF